VGTKKAALTVSSQKETLKIPPGTKAVISTSIVTQTRSGTSPLTITGTGSVGIAFDESKKIDPPYGDGQESHYIWHVPIQRLVRCVFAMHHVRVHLPFPSICQ
jgi:hypothetical protein